MPSVKIWQNSNIELNQMGYQTPLRKFKEYGLNRETQPFMELQITVEKFHQCNHTSCGESFESSEYASLDGKNTQSCEQTNAKLRQIATSCTESRHVHDSCHNVLGVSEPCQENVIDPKYQQRNKT